MADLLTPRRYYLSASRTAGLEGMPGVAAVLLSFRNALPGTPLPATFPAYDKLIAAQYVALEDLAGADVDELMSTAGCTSYEALSVIAARG